MSSAAARALSATSDFALPEISGAAESPRAAGPGRLVSGGNPGRADALLALRQKLAAQAPARQAPPPLETTLAPLDAALQGGLPRGKLVEIAGGAGKLAFTLLSLAAATQRGELCAFIDVEDALDVQTAERVGVDLDQLLWVRPRLAGRAAAEGREGAEALGGAAQAEKATAPCSPEDRVSDGLKALDLVLSAGGFGLVVLYLGASAAGSKAAARACASSAAWSRVLGRAEKANTALLLVSDEAVSGSFAVATLRCAAGEAVWQRVPGGRWLLHSQRTAIEVTRSRLSAPGDSIALRMLR